MKFLKAFLINLALLIIVLTIVYFLTPEIWNTGAQFFIVFLGPVTSLIFLILFLVVTALPRRR
jgi:hypothetical protein